MLIKTDTGYSRMFLSGAWYNWLVSVSCGLGYRAVFPALGIAPMPEQLVYFQLFMVAVFMFGCGYYMVSRDLSQTALVLIGAIAKLLVFVIVGYYWLVGAASWHMAALGSVDLVYAVLFIGFLRSRKARIAVGKGIANE